MADQKPVLTLRPATLDDVPAMTDVYFDAFGHSTISQRCFPSEDPESVSHWTGRIRSCIGIPGTHVVVASLSDSPSPSPSPGPEPRVPAARVVGWVRWVRKPAAPPPLPDPPVFAAAMYPSCGDGELAARFFGAAAGATHRLVAGREHWMLSMIATRRNAQRKGVGAALMKYGVDFMDEDGWMGYVNASPEGKLLYERFGFRVVDQLWFEELRQCLFHMKRDPKAKDVNDAR